MYRVNDIVYCSSEAPASSCTRARLDARTIMCESIYRGTSAGQSASLAVTQLGSCASSGRAWRLWAARHSQKEASSLSAQPLPRVLEPAASKAAHFIAVDHQAPY